MRSGERNGKLLIFLGSISLVVMFMQGCSTEGVVGGVAGVTLVTGMTPSNSIEQIYYLGVFDPQEQVPATIYRVTVRGQASAISAMRFGSGWVHADLIDSLNSRIVFDKESGKIKIERTDDTKFDPFKKGRRMFQFGPEGFREAPKDHRLVIIMGSSPEKFFQNIDMALGQITQMRAEQKNSKLNKLLFEALVQTKNERENLTDLKKDLKNP